ncbi:MAG: TadE/TadG family type IV pilus assembly protein [Actinomycetes bacterium]
MGRDGQSTVEFVLVLPLVLTVLLGALQVVVVVRHRIRLEQALHVAARTAALAEPDRAAAEADRAARAAVPGTRATIDRRPQVGGLLRVTVTARSRTDLPVVGPLLPDPILRATTVVRAEG